MNDITEPTLTRGALNDLAALAWKWEERARAAERTLARRKSGRALLFLAGMLAGGAASALGFALGACT